MASGSIKATASVCMRACLVHLLIVFMDAWSVISEG